MYSDGSAKATVKETTESEHKLGIGAAVDGGNWGADGTTEIDTHTAGYAQRTYNSLRRIFNQVNYRHFNRRCGMSGLPWTWHTYHQVRPEGFYDLQTESLSRKLAGQEYWTNCSRHSSGTYGKIDGSNITYSGGVKLGFVNLSAQASFSHQTEESWHITRRNYLCGSTAAGWLNAPQAAARVSFSPPY